MSTRSQRHPALRLREVVFGRSFGVASPSIFLIRSVLFLLHFIITQKDYVPAWKPTLPKMCHPSASIWTRRPSVHGRPTALQMLWSSIENEEFAGLRCLVLSRGVRVFWFSFLYPLSHFMIVYSLYISYSVAQPALRLTTRSKLPPLYQSTGHDDRE